MNSFVATVTAIQSNEQLTLLQCESHATKILMMSLELGSDIQVGSRIKLAVKPTNILLSRTNAEQNSCENSIPVTLEAVEEGELLCSVVLRFVDADFEAIITREACKRLDVQKSDRLFMLLSASDIYIEELLDV
jgi:ABC-type molybdate transport system ATPase subunit